MSSKQPGRGEVMDFDKTDMEMIRRGDMLDPTLGAKVAAALETLQRERDEAREAAKHILPYLRWTIGDESPGHHPTMPSAVAAFEAAFGFERAPLSPKEAEE